MKALVMLVVLVALSAQGLTFRRSFRNGYPAELNISKEEARDTFHLGRSGVVQSDGRGQVMAVRTVNDLSGTVVDVFDGATIGLELPERGKVRVRLRGLSVPSVSRPTGQACRDHLSSLLLNKSVRVEWRQKDRSGALFGTVFLDCFGGAPMDVGLQMLADGYAMAVTGYDPRYTATQNKARAASQGLWKKSAQPQGTKTAP